MYLNPYAHNDGGVLISQQIQLISPHTTSGKSQPAPSDLKNFILPILPFSLLSNTDRILAFPKYHFQ